jgi:homoisocitrate dehydrogenase
MSPHSICLLGGDGIGPEVTEQAARVLQALPLSFEFSRAEIGFGAYQKYGSPLPPETEARILAAEATLFGAVTTPPDIPGYFSPVLRMRQKFDLYANIRPCKSLPHPGSRPGLDMIIVRENTEDLYSGVERVEDGGNRAISEMIITRRASERVVRKAFELAAAGGYHKVTIVHKANVLRQTCGLFRRVAFEVAAQFPAIQAEEMLVDTCAMELIRAPEQFQVIVTTNLFGDILSDEASMLVGGLGVAYSGNIGENAAIFEPVHGSAPKIAGQGKANPAAAILSAAFMLEYIGEPQQAARLRQAVLAAMSTGQVTEDLGGRLSTIQAADAVIRLL